MEKPGEKCDSREEGHPPLIKCTVQRELIIDNYSMRS